MLNCIGGEHIGLNAGLRTKARRRKHTLHRLQAQADDTADAAPSTRVLHGHELSKGLLALQPEVQLPALLLEAVEPIP